MYSETEKFIYSEISVKLYKFIYLSKFALMSNNKNQFTELLCNNLNEHLITATNTLDDSASEVYASKTHKANCLS